MGEVGHHAVGNTMCIPNVGMASMAAMCCVKDLGEDAGFLARSAEQIEFASFVEKATVKIVPADGRCLFYCCLCAQMSRRDDDAAGLRFFRNACSV